MKKTFKKNSRWLAKDTSDVVSSCCSLWMKVALAQMLVEPPKPPLEFSLSGAIIYLSTALSLDSILAEFGHVNLGISCIERRIWG